MSGQKGGVTSREWPGGFFSLFSVWMGVGGVYGWWGFSRASKILFGCIVCSSFK